MDALDGNAIAGTLYEVFGSEMTTAIATCAGCDTSMYLGEYAVYMGGPGIVVRCHRCDSLAMALVKIRGVTCVDEMGLSAIRLPE